MAASARRWRMFRFQSSMTIIYRKLMRMPTVELPGLSRTGKRWARIRLLLLFGDVTVGRGIRNIARTCKEKAGRIVSPTSVERATRRSEEHTYEIQSLMSTSYAVI